LASTDSSIRGAAGAFRRRVSAARFGGAFRRREKRGAPEFRRFVAASAYNAAMAPPFVRANVREM